MIKVTAKMKSRCPNCGKLNTTDGFSSETGNHYTCQCGEVWSDDKPGISPHMQVEIINVSNREIICEILDFPPPRKGEIIVLDGKAYEVQSVLWLLIRDEDDCRPLHPLGIVNIQVEVKKLN
jgi:uncharacterized Zn finger protein